jgi:hypothetical protein
VSLYKAFVSQGCKQGVTWILPLQVNTAAARVCRLQSSLCEHCDSFGRLRRKFIVALQDEVVRNVPTWKSPPQPLTFTRSSLLLTPPSKQQTTHTTHCALTLTVRRPTTVKVPLIIDIETKSYNTGSRLSLSCFPLHQIATFTDITRSSHYLQPYLTSGSNSRWC